MKSHLAKFGWILLALNISLFLISALLGFYSTIRHPMQGQLLAASEQKLHVIDSLSSTSPDPGSKTPLSAGDDADSEEKPTIVLIHGASTSALDFSTNLQPRLSEHWRVVAIDRPGHGYSERGDAIANADPAEQAAIILDVLHTMGIADPVLVGHSWAGSVVMAALLQQHNHVRVRAGVLIAGATHPWEGGSAWHVELSARPLVGTIFRWQYIEPIGRLQLGDAIASVFSPEAVPENYIENTGLTLSLRPTTYKHNALDVTQLSDYLENQAPQYANISQPLLSIAADDDHVVPAWNHHDRLIKQIDHLQTLNIPGAGHAPHHTRTAQVVSAIEQFVHSLEK